MNVGQLFEEALKEAHIDLSPDLELRVHVQKEGRRLKLHVALSEFETEILRRSKHTSKAKIYSPHSTIGERIRAIRIARDFSLQILADKAHISRGSLGSIETNTRSVGLEVLTRIAKALGVSVDQLVTP